MAISVLRHDPGPGLSPHIIAGLSRAVAGPSTERVYRDAPGLFRRLTRMLMSPASTETLGGSAIDNRCRARGRRPMVHTPLPLLHTALNTQLRAICSRRGFSPRP